MKTHPVYGIDMDQFELTFEVMERKPYIRHEEILSLFSNDIIYYYFDLNYSEFKTIYGISIKKIEK